ncbi:cysteine-rich receptor-like protein kinase 3 isoform X2 [Prosopis cineraria]|uniref:cysteine-rich receptor-like protein kinase 3 isoform X2 n=1 Tax=Prosopis cineraria TaxID=364024 RepID=UPI00240F38A9|nr:cysteine-rich receptor-like protein kinase 3 isoform X2 [Prosopis cineraria]
MLGPHCNLLPLLTFIVWSCCSLDGVASEPQIHLLSARCNPPDFFLVSNSSILTENLNATFRDIRGQIMDQKKHFATAQKGNGENFPVYTLFQCRNYLSTADCAACFDVAAVQIRTCSAATSPSPGAYVVYDGCFIRYNYNTFFNEATQTFDGVSCGNETTGGASSAFTEAIQRLLTNLQIATPTIPSFFAATKMNVSNNGATVYAFAQCVETITTKGCLDCLKAGYSNLQICLPFSDGRAFDAGCFMRYSTTSLFHDNQTIDITPLVKKGSSNKLGKTIGGIVGVVLALILLALFAWIRQPKGNKTVPRGSNMKSDLTEVSKLKGPVTYSYNDLMLATKNFSEENKLGEGGFGVVYKGTLKNGKVIAVKKLTLHHFNRVEEDFESEVTLISNVHHRNLVRLLGCCSRGHNRILVYEYMKNSSLDKFLFGNKKGSLNWKQRYDITLGIARDDDLQPKIADFGLARLLPGDKTHVSTKLAGTLGYTAPEYAIHGQLSEKADIYSYGVVVLEIISGQKCRELNVDGDDEGAFLLQRAWRLYEKERHLELVDKTLDPNGYDAEEVKKTIEIGLLCTQASADIRPMMSEVVALLQNKDLLENIRPTMPILIETN